MRETLQHYAWMFLTCGLVFFVNLGGPRLWDRDEPRNAGCAVEMMERGDWIVPMFNSELRVHKPVLLYWFMMSAYALFGVSEFAARFWSAVFGLGTVLATYHIGRRLFSAQTGLWAAVILPSCIMFPVAARAATPDSVLIFFTTLATLVYVHGAFPPLHGTFLAHAGRCVPFGWPDARAGRRHAVGGHVVVEAETCPVHAASRNRQGVGPRRRAGETSARPWQAGSLDRNGAQRRSAVAMFDAQLWASWACSVSP